MTPSDSTPRPARGDSHLAFGIMFFAVAILCFMLGWADGVRHGHPYLRFPPLNSWMIATAILAALSVAFLVCSRSGRRG